MMMNEWMIMMNKSMMNDMIQWINDGLMNE